MKRNKAAAAAVGALLLITVVVALIHIQSRVPAREGALQIEADGQTVELVLKELEPQEVRGVVVNGKGEERTIEAQGVPLSQVLDRAGIVKYAQVTVVADDEYSAVVTQEEAEEPERVFLLLEEGEQPQLLVFGDANSKRNVSGVIRMIVQ